MTTGRQLLLRAHVAALCAMVFVIASDVSAQETARVADPSKTTYGEMSPRAPKELQTFAFLIGTWDGKGRTRLADGKVAEYPVTWIGRYILDGTAIADEVHAPAPDGTRTVGITFRQYDANRGTWVVEFLNVSGSFLRRQVHQGAGSVVVQGRNVTVASESPEYVVREHYLVSDNDSWMYRLDVSTDRGKSWNDGWMEFTFRRSK